MLFRREHPPVPTRERQKASELDGAQRIARRLTAPGPKRILAIDGGGTRGIVAVRFLAEIERTLQKKLGRGDDFVLADYFDLVGGTSAGALIATLVARRCRVSEIERQFEAFAHDIFRSRTRRLASRIEARFGHCPSWLVQGRNVIRLISGCDKYDARALEQRIAAVVGTEPMASAELHTGLAVISKRADTNSVWIMTNNPNARYFDDQENRPGHITIGNGFYRIADVLRASTAAPTVFRPVDIAIHDVQGHTVKTGRFIDGGVSPHNSPALQLFLMASLSKFNLGGPGKPWRVRPGSLLMVSVGTGSFDTPMPESMPLLFRAMYALSGMITDGGQLGLTVLQSISEPKTPWFIDNEVRDLMGASVGGLKALTFQRYDLPLERNWLMWGDQRAGIRNGPHMRLACRRYPGSLINDMPRLQEMDAPEMMERLWGLATAAARDQVCASHFPDAFDNVWTDPDASGPAAANVRTGS